MKKPKKKEQKPSRPESPDAPVHVDEFQPWHITPMGCLYASAVLIGLVIITFPFDLAISSWFREHPLRGDLKRLINLCEVFGYGFTALLVIVTAAAIDRRSWRVVPRLLLGTYCAGAAANLGKIIVARWRPNTAFEPTGVRDSFVSWFPWVWPDELPGPWNSGYASFPSGHSATAVGLALSLSIFYPKGTWWFLFLAGLTMLQRIESRAHYPSDTFAGAAVACLVTALLLHSRWLERRLRRLETGPASSALTSN